MITARSFHSSQARYNRGRCHSGEEPYCGSLWPASSWSPIAGLIKGYFSDDDLDNLVQTRRAEPAAFVDALLSPKFNPDNFRPVGHFFYKALGATAGLNFKVYVAVLHSLHLVNVWMVWLLLRRLGAPLFGAGAGALLFAFHMACFDAYWKPMFVFDVLCATFLLVTILLYLRGHWLLAVVPYWLPTRARNPLSHCLHFYWPTSIFAANAVGRGCCPSR